MNEQQEAIIREHTMLLILRNQGKVYVMERILKRFLKCIKSTRGLQLKFPIM